MVISLPPLFYAEYIRVFVRGCPAEKVQKLKESFFPNHLNLKVDNLVTGNLGHIIGFDGYIAH